MAKAKHPALTEAEIQQRIASDPDAPEATDEQLAQARPFAEAFPELAASIRRGRGPGVKAKKEVVTLRLDPDVIAHFKGEGSGWQTRINDALRMLTKVGDSGGWVHRDADGRFHRMKRPSPSKKRA